MLAISVVLPVYNGSAYLRETLQSAINQRYPAAEIIVVDDGSKDDSAEIARSVGPNFSRGFTASGVLSSILRDLSVQ